MKYKTFAEFQDAMIEAAKEIQGGNYPGDDYYRDVCWMENWKNANHVALGDAECGNGVVELWDCAYIENAHGATTERVYAHQ